MTGRLAWRSLTAHPVRSAVLAAGFGFGVAVMAILLGVAEVVLDQAVAPALVGGGDVVIRNGADVPARLVLSGTLQSKRLRSRVRVVGPTERADLFLMRGGRAVAVAARGSIPSRDRALGIGETRGVGAWRDTTADRAWIDAPPDIMLREADRFHAIPDVPAWSSSWAEWLYFNGRAGDARFYLTFLVGPRTPRGGRAAGVRLQLERNGRMETYRAAAELTDAEVARAPDLTIGANRVRLDGMTYRIHLDVADETGQRAQGNLTIAASAGQLVPPIEVRGAGGWLTGYVVPVLSGPLSGSITARGTRARLDGGVGYHDHNWGFWEGVSWQWGQVQFGDRSLLYGRVFPPREAADPERMPGFLGVVGPEGPMGYANDVFITETNGPDNRPRAIDIQARGPGLNLTLRFEVDTTVTTRTTQAPVASGMDLLQMRGRYAIAGEVGGQKVKTTAPGAAETFRTGGG